MVTACSAAESLGTTANGFARICDLGAHPVPTFVARADGRIVVVEQLASKGRPMLGRDAASLARLQHPNLPRVRGVVPTSSGVDLVTDYIRGQSLAELERAAQAEGAYLPLEVELRILVDVLNGLSALHGHRDENRSRLGLVHGHVTPANVIVGLDGAARIVHVLLPRSLGGGAEANPFEPPELAAGEIDARTDVFSAGVLLHLAVRAANTPWGEPFAEVAARAMHPDKSARFACAAEMAAEVRKIAMAKLAIPRIVAAAVEDLAGEPIEERSKRTPVESRLAIALGIPRVGSFSDDAPTVPRMVPSEWLRRAGLLLSTPMLAKSPLPAARKDLPAAGEPTAPGSPALPPSPSLVSNDVPTHAIERSKAAVERDVRVTEPPLADGLLAPVFPPEVPARTLRRGYEWRKRIALGVVGFATLILVVAAIRAVVPRRSSAVARGSAIPAVVSASVAQGVSSIAPPAIAPSLLPPEASQDSRLPKAAGLPVNTTSDVVSEAPASPRPAAGSVRVGGGSLSPGGVPSPGGAAKARRALSKPSPKTVSTYYPLGI
jgi:eukaryotic-like serine/threonine-protein kinase